MKRQFLIRSGHEKKHFFEFCLPHINIQRTFPLTLEAELNSVSDLRSQICIPK